MSEIDKSLFGRLQRLLSRDVVIRPMGKGQIKVVDIHQVQQNGKLASNSILDRRTGIYRSPIGNFGLPNSGANQLLRTQYYIDYETMDRDAYIHSALNLLADESTLKDEKGEVLRIQSTDENIKRILYNLFYDVMNIEFNLWGWVRSMVKYGDAFLHLSITEGYGVTGVMPMSPYCMTREDDMDRGTAKFYYDPSATGAGQNNVRKEYYDYEIAHLRMSGDTNFLPYGLSYIEGARLTWKSLNLAEDASLLHRITRSADKRIFFVDIGNMTPAEVEPFMQNIINKTKKIPHIDPATGDYNLKFNIMNLLEDYYIPTRANDKQTRIETAAGLQFAGMEDVEYWKKKLFAALMIPKAYFGEEGDTQGKGTLSQLDLRLSRMIERLQRIIISEFKKIAMIHLFAQGYRDNNMFNFELSLTTPSIVYKQEKVALLKDMMDLAQQMMDSGIFSSDWIYKNLFELSDDEFEEERALVLEDKKRVFRQNQIENEGNDPVKSGKAMGTKHAMAAMYNNKVHVQGNGTLPSESLPNPDNTGNDPGRPVQHAGGLGTDRSSFGRDPLGSKDAMTQPGLDKQFKLVFQSGSPMALTESQKALLQDEAILAIRTETPCNLFENETAQSLEDLAIFNEKLLE